MPGALSDALVFFGATGDLAYKKIFPALQSMIRHGRLAVPVIGVSRAGWSLAQLRERARHGRLAIGYGARDRVHNNAVALADVLRRGAGAYGQVRLRPTAAASIGLSPPPGPPTPSRGRRRTCPAERTE